MLVPRARLPAGALAAQGQAPGQVVFLRMLSVCFSSSEPDRKQRAVPISNSTAAAWPDPSARTGQACAQGCFQFRATETLQGPWHGFVGRAAACRGAPAPGMRFLGTGLKPCVPQTETVPRTVHPLDLPQTKLDACRRVGREAKGWVACMSPLR